MHYAQTMAFTTLMLFQLFNVLNAPLPQAMSAGWCATTR